jgi:hypothetical protein
VIEEVSAISSCLIFGDNGVSDDVSEGRSSLGVGVFGPAEAFPVKPPKLKLLGFSFSAGI